MASERVGDWFQTFSGVQFYPYDPRPEDVLIEDIAHHLSLICRFNGAVTRHYSVAQHSCIVSEIVPRPLAMWGLLHDAAEAYVGDMVRPLKRGMPAFCEVEAGVMAVICARFGLDPIEPPEVKDADNRALATERRDLLKIQRPWTFRGEPLDWRIEPQSPVEAEHDFLRHFRTFARSSDAR